MLKYQLKSSNNAKKIKIMNCLIFIKKTEIDHEILILQIKFPTIILKQIWLSLFRSSVLSELINVKYLLLLFRYLHQQIIINTKTLNFMPKKVIYLIEERDIKEKLFTLISSLYNDKSSIKKILSNQDKHSDKDVFKILNTLIKNILNEKN